MGFDDNLDADVYNNLTESTRNSSRFNKKWTLNLALCCITAALASFQFGYNIASNNSPTELIKNFIRNETFLFREYYEKKALFDLNENYIIGNQTKLREAKLEYEKRKEEYIMSFFSLDLNYRQELENRKLAKEKEIRDKHNMTIDEYLASLTKKLEEKKALLETYRVKLRDGYAKVNKVTDIIWTAVNSLFVVGGMIGAFTSKYVLDYLGRKKGILLVNIFSIVASIIALLIPYTKSPVSYAISRFIFGIHGGMSCSLVPTYISEISPANLRGQTGVIHQFFITFGILTSQLLGFEQILGSEKLWHYLIGFCILPAIIADLLLFLLFSETPRALLIKNKDEYSARRALQLLRNLENVNYELQELIKETAECNSSETISLKELFTIQDIRWPLITSIILQIAQQLSGINAIFFYSQEIFKNAHIPLENIQYFIFITGLCNLLATIICVPLIDRYGRKPLLVYPMVIIVIDFIILTILLANKDKSIIFSYVSIGCILVFVMCFAVGLGPIPFLYTAECFRQNARSSAMAICTLVNWLSALILSLSFNFLQKSLQHNVFIIFTIVITASLLFILKNFKRPKAKMWRK